MQIIFIGTGSSFVTLENNFSANVLLSDPDSSEKLLINCGTDAKRALTRLGLSYREITDIYISQLNADHVGGLEWIALARKFDAHCQRPNLYINPHMASVLWHQTLSGGMMTIQGTDAKLRSFFKVNEIDSNENFFWQDIEFQTVQTTFSSSHTSLLPSQGLVFTLNGIKIFLTSETELPSEQLMFYYQNADIIFQDCETGFPKIGIHPTFSELEKLPASIKAKMWLYHYNTQTLPDAVSAGFKGFVMPGQIFEFSAAPGEIAGSCFPV